MGHNFSFCKTCETPLDCDFCDKLAELMEPGRMTLEELKAEAKRQGYKLIKAKRSRFETCLCGHNVHQWCSRRGMENMVYCKHCGLESPWVKGGNAAVIEAWNAMILEKRKERSHEYDVGRGNKKPGRVSEISGGHWSKGDSQLCGGRPLVGQGAEGPPPHHQGAGGEDAGEVFPGRDR